MVAHNKNAFIHRFISLGAAKLLGPEIHKKSDQRQRAIETIFNAFQKGGELTSEVCHLFHDITNIIEEGTTEHQDQVNLMTDFVKFLNINKERIENFAEMQHIGKNGALYTSKFCFFTFLRKVIAAKRFRETLVKGEKGMQDLQVDADFGLNIAEIMKGGDANAHKSDNTYQGLVNLIFNNTKDVDFLVPPATPYVDDEEELELAGGAQEDLQRQSEAGPAQTLAQALEQNRGEDGQPPARVRGGATTAGIASPTRSTDRTP